MWNGYYKRKQFLQTDKNKKKNFYSITVVFELALHQNHLRACLSRCLGPTPRVSDSEGLGRAPQIYIVHKFLGDANAIGLGTTLEEPLTY